MNGRASLQERPARAALIHCAAVLPLQDLLSAADFIVIQYRLCLLLYTLLLLRYSGELIAIARGMAFQIV